LIFRIVIIALLMIRVALLGAYSTDAPENCKTCRNDNVIVPIQRDLDDLDFKTFRNFEARPLPKVGFWGGGGDGDLEAV